jgi:hypothetical protein
MFSPGQHLKTEVQSHDHDWQVKGRHLKSWLQRIKQEHEAPDLWAEIGKERALSDAASSMVENQPFTVTEQQQITTALVEIKQYLLTIRDTQVREAEFIEGQFRYLNDSMKRLGRKDWLNILFSTLLSTAFNIALPPENVKGLMQLAAATMHWLVGGAQRLIQ